MTRRFGSAPPVNDDSVFAPNRDVLSVRQAGQLAVLSLLDQTYFTFNESAAAIWQSICGGVPLGITARRLSQSYGISDEDAKRDVYALVTMLQRRSLIRASDGHVLSSARKAAPSSAHLKPSTLPGVARCFALLFLTSFALRAFGSARFVGDAISGEMDERAVPPEDASLLTRRMRLAAAWLPWTGTCLPQSLALIHVLRELGYRPTLRLGVYPAPFSAHAWVACGGRPVNETSEQLMRYRILEFDRGSRS